MLFTFYHNLRLRVYEIMNKKTMDLIKGVKHVLGGIIMKRHGELISIISVSLQISPWQQIEVNEKSKNLSDELNYN